MNTVFRQTYEIQTIHLDRFGRVKPSVLLYFAQEVAGGHCRELSLTWEDMAEKGLFWAVIRHRLQITRMPVAGDVLTVETWPMPTTRAAFPRAVAAYDAEGNEVFRCVSLWVLMDRNTRAMVVPEKSGVELQGLLRGSELATPGTIIPRQGENVITRQACFTELDRNGHMNNTRYLDWVSDLLPSDFHETHIPKEISVCYHSEVLEGQPIGLRWQLSDGPVLQVDARREKTDVCEKKDRAFSVLVHY